MPAAASIVPPPQKSGWMPSASTHCVGNRPLHRAAEDDHAGRCVQAMMNRNTSAVGNGVKIATNSH